MNQLGFNILPIDDGRYSVADPLVDGERLISLLRKHETPFAKREGHADIAGAYMGFPPQEVFLPSKRFLGDCEDFDSEDDMVAILGCDCGCGGCWPFLARIEVTGTKVRWTDFKQPHRGKDAVAGYWDYSKFPKFEFDLEQYREALTLPEAQQ